MTVSVKPEGTQKAPREKPDPLREPACSLLRVTLARETWDDLEAGGVEMPPVEYLGPDLVRTVDLVREDWLAWLTSVAKVARFEPRKDAWRFRWTNAEPRFDRRGTIVCATRDGWRLMAVPPDLLDWQCDLYRGSGGQVRLTHPADSAIQRLQRRNQTQS